MAGGVILCINSGSSSLKFAVFRARRRGLEREAEGAVEGVGLPESTAWIRAGEHPLEQHRARIGPAGALDRAMRLLEVRGLRDFDVVGHRVVHGGTRYTAPVRIDGAVLATLRSLAPLAPLHLPPAIAAIEQLAGAHPGTPQVACFDTAFHALMPEVARRLPVPRHLHDAGVRRYGFHGLSFESVMSTLGADACPRMVIAHLGAGSSLVALRDGRSIDTSMGLTPAGGVIMATRTGDIDPGVLVHLVRQQGLSADRLEHFVFEQAGLLGIGGTSDMKTLLTRADSGDPEARLAITMFAYSVKKGIGGLVAALGGIDLLVFTGGIGEHVAEVRREVCRGLEAMGIVLDEQKNVAGEAILSARDSRCTVRVVASDEDRMIAEHAQRVVQASGASDVPASGPAPRPT